MAAKLFIGQCSSSIALQSCSADALFTLGMQYLSLGVLKCVFGVRYAVSVLVIKAETSCTKSWAWGGGFKPKAPVQGPNPESMAGSPRSQNQLCPCRVLLLGLKHQILGPDLQLKTLQSDWLPGGLDRAGHLLDASPYICGVVGYFPDFSQRLFDGSKFWCSRAFSDSLVFQTKILLNPTSCKVTLRASTPLWCGF